MRLSLILFICGIMNVLWGVLMLIPAVVDYFSNSEQNGEVFLLCALGVSFVGTFVSALAYRTWDEKPSLREMFIITSMVWLSMGVIGGMPFYFSGLGLSFTDAIFESISGLTGTGATILTHIDQLPKGFLIWRAMTQWIGGIGIILLAITILPILRIGGMQMFAMENSDLSGKDAPFVTSKLKRFFGVYVLLSFLCLWCLYVAGMDLFDATAHAMTCVSTGGFSTHDLSIGYFNSPSIEWILIFFMTLGALPLAFTISLMEHKWDRIKEDSQAKTFLIGLIIVIIPMALLMWLFMARFDDFEPTLRTLAFHVVSIVSTTGYVSENYTLWGGFFILFFFLLTVVGGCTGSTSGGIKIFRFSVLFKSLKRHLTLMVSPNAIVIPRYNGKPITDDVMLGVLSFITIFGLTWISSALILSLTGLDFITSLSAAASSIANVGPGLGKLIGPDQTYQLLPDVAKWTLAFTMILGRLEFMTILILFLPKLWTKN